MKKRYVNLFVLLLIAVISLLAASPAMAATGRSGGPMKAIKPPAMTEAQSQRFKARIYSAVLDMEPSVAIDDLLISTEIPREEMDAYVVGLATEHPDVFYFHPGYSQYVSPQGDYYNKVYLYYRYDTKEEVEIKRAVLESKIQEGLSWIPSGATDLQKVKALNDFVCASVTYWEGPDLNAAPRTAYQALVLGTDVCEGYALSLMLLLSRVGIETQWVTNDGHAWIKVKIDGKWYHVDPTWADQDGGIWNGVIFKSDSYFLNQNNDGYHSQWKQTSPACTDTRYDNIKNLGETSAWPTYTGPASQTTATSFNLSHTSLTLLENGGIANLTISNVTPSGVNTGRAIYTSSNTEVALVTNTGVVSAKNPGTATITCRLDGITRTCAVTVTEDVGNFSKGNYSVSVSEELFVYNGSSQKPVVTVVRDDGGDAVTLTEGTDYYVKWPADTVNYGVKRFTVEGRGDYSGLLSSQYFIMANDISNTSLFTITYMGSGSFIYNGNEKPGGGDYIYVTLRYSYQGLTVTLPKGSAYIVTYEDNINAGSNAKMIVTGIGDYTGTQTKYFTINQADLSAATVSAPDQSFTGSALTPDPTVKLGSVTLTKGVDYETSYSNNVAQGTATITVTGKGNYKGTASGSFNITAPVHVHDLSGTPAVAASCTEAGNSAYYTCSECGKHFSDAAGQNEITEGSWIIYATGHTPGQTVTENTVSATCTAAGSHDNVVYCTVCTKEVSREKVTDPALTHSLTETPVVAASCTEAGNSAYYTCSRCDKFFSDAAGNTQIEEGSWIIAATGHTPGQTVTENTVPATCAAAGSHDNVVYCTVCTKEVSREKVTDPALPHSLSETQAVAASCTEAGNSAYYTCSECGKYFSDAAGKREITKDSWIIAAKGHTPGQTVKENTVSATCTAAGSHDNVVYCTVCEVELSRKKVTDAATGHSYGAWTVVKAATEKEEGVEERVCSHDPEHKESRSIPKVNARVTGVKLNTTSTKMLTKDSDLLPGQTDARLALTASVLPENAANKKVKWTTSNSSIATVDSSGMVTGLKTGTVTITATTVEGGKTASCKVQVMSRKEVKLTAGAVYVFQSKLNSGFSMDVMLQNHTKNTNVSLYKTNKSRAAEKFTLEKKLVNGKTCYLFIRKNSTVGKRAITELKGKNLVFGAAKYTNWQFFRAYQFNDGAVQFINRGSNNAIAVEGGKAASRANIAPAKADLGTAQRWTCVKVG